ncbi:hypothetical protein Z517_05959 [Fonsecaea pedrosoi CBS 271.37]|uniref:Uncharacterized protein n=1 Tax=Fonsecaea pedrosoi CBS 271.37 TaxID=1442368 RepID=A0A0D2EYN4_9EURO|nr:uncharacterized protein Z517_05959 [Fonsecaea pedrosoi CBS 271.37]KIW79347.1 hypothetical protein Z517_05959 [Fonsecaea pedrosoi CBS 271.37]
MDSMDLTTIPAVPQGGNPFAIPFFLHIQHVRYQEAIHQASHISAPDFYWRPSLGGRFVHEGTSGWWIWDPAQLPGAVVNQACLRRPTAEETARRRWHRTSTLVWDPERHGYIHAPIDCTTTHFDAETWRRLGFSRRLDSQQNDLAIIGHDGEGYRLHLPGPHDWFEQLLPDVCKAQMDGQPTCKLAGYLSILIGLLAFGVEPRMDWRVIDASFRRDISSTQFQLHDLEPGLRHMKRSMVIEIGYDPALVSTDMLKRWEAGDFGEIFS